MEWKPGARQKSAPTTQTFAAVHPAIVIVWENWGSDKFFRIAYSTTMENAILQDRRSTRISINRLSLICDSSLLCRKDNYTLPIDRNPNAHCEVHYFYITYLEIVHCTSENQAKVSYFIMGSSSTQNFCSGHLSG